MRSLCSLLLVTTAAICHAGEKPNPLEKEGEPLSVIKMPTGKLPIPRPLPAPMNSKKDFPTDTKVAIEGKFKVADPKNFRPFFVIVKFKFKHKKHGWVVGNSGLGKKPVEVKKGLYRYRSVVETPKHPHPRYLIEVYQRRKVIARTWVDVDGDLE